MAARIKVKQAYAQMLDKNENVDENDEWTGLRRLNRSHEVKDAQTLNDAI